MANMLTKRTSLVTSLFLIAVLAFSVANAFPKRDVENLCRETAHAAFCVKLLETDPRISNAGGLNQVLVITITLSKMQVDDATTHIRSITKKYNGPHGKRRIALCNRNYGIAVARFETAWAFALNSSFRDAARLSDIGTRAVMGCENAWSKGGPVQKSPLTLYNTNVSKILEIIRLLVRKLAP